MTRRVSTWIVGIFTILATLIVHGQLLFKTELLVRDDRWLTAPLKNITSLADWWAAIRSAELPDFQPVRDFSYWLDWRRSIRFLSSPLPGSRGAKPDAQMDRTDDDLRFDRNHCNSHQHECLSRQRNFWFSADATCSGLRSKIERSSHR